MNLHLLFLFEEGQPVLLFILHSAVMQPFSTKKTSDVSMTWPQLERPEQICRDPGDLHNEEKAFSTAAINNRMYGRKLALTCYSKEVHYWIQM